MLDTTTFPGTSGDQPFLLKQSGLRLTTLVGDVRSKTRLPLLSMVLMVLVLMVGVGLVADMIGGVVLCPARQILMVKIDGGGGVLATTVDIAAVAKKEHSFLQNFAQV